MKDTDINNIKAEVTDESTPTPTGGAKKRALWLRVLLWAAGGIFGLVALVVIALCVLTWWYTPRRLASLISREVSEQINADLSLSEVRYTLWSSFPHLNLEIDSISLRSRNFDSIPASVARTLPAGADSLISARFFKGSVNLMELLSDRIMLKDIAVDSLRVNLVAATDSLNNYEIVSSGGKTRIPYFHVDGLTIGKSGAISYTSVPTATSAAVTLTGATLRPSRHSHHKDTYALNLDGHVDVNSSGLRILHNFPFALSGNVGVRFKPFGIRTDDYRVALGNVQGHMSMDLDIGDSARMNQFAYSMSNFTLQDLMAFLPEGNYPALEHLEADLALDASARLTSAYEFSSAYLPSIEVDFRVPEGKVAYVLSDGHRYSMDRVGLDGRLVFDGRNPQDSYVEIPRMNMSGEGIDMNLAGKITDLTTTPGVTARLNATGDLGRVSRVVPQLKPFNLNGNLDVGADVRFRLNGSDLYGALADLNVKTDNVSLTQGSTKVNISDFEITTSESYQDLLTKGALLNNIPLEVKAKAGRLTVTDPASALKLDARGVKAEGYVSRHKDGGVERAINLKTSADVLNMIASGLTLRLDGFSSSVDANRLSAPMKTAPFRMPADWDKDTRSRSFVKHTPEYLQVRLPDNLKQLMAMWKGKVNIDAAGGMLGTSRHPASTRIGSLGVTASLDSVHLRHLTLSQDATRGTLSARVTNLRQFLMSPVPAPLNVWLDADLDTVQINQLARTYTSRHPESAIARGDKEAMAEGPDSVALLIPRNLNAVITARAKQTRYINLHLYDLLANVRLQDGRAEVDTLRIGSDFGWAGLNLTFDTSDLQDMNLSTRLNITDVNVVNFFKNFHKLLLMMPQMKNFSGVLSAGVDARMRIFPSMFLNVPSVWADAHIGGRDMVVKQSPFIRKVTKMLMIPGSDPLHIENVTVHAGVHNNLLEIYPFPFEMSKYRLVLGGVNNFDGELYYHVGVVDWPLKIPFGINIKGDFHHPKLKFGGKDWHDRNGALITDGVDDNNSINLMKMGRRYMGEFVHTAATYEGE